MYQTEGSVIIIPMATPNTLFAIIDVSNPAIIRGKLQALAPWLWLELQDGQWLIVAPSSTTSKEVSDRLDLSGPGQDTAIVLRVESYFGRNHAPVWEWISAKQGAELGITAPA